MKFIYSTKMKRKLDSSSKKKRKLDSSSEYEDCNLSNLEDRISVLPNEILVSIVSLLPLQNAGATSILSRPWKNVWNYTSNLNFDCARFLVGKEYLAFRPNQSESLYSLSSRFVDCVNKVLDLHKGQRIEKFSANFFLDCRFTLFIDQWIHFALKKGVQILELDFLDQFFVVAKPYTITKTLLGLGSEFDLESSNSCTLSRGACGFSTGFKSLKVLHLRNVGVTGKVLNSLLHKCPVLEKLSLVAVDELRYIKVGGPLIAFKHLVIRHCTYLNRVEICDTKLVSFDYYGYRDIALNISNVPLLTEVSFFELNYRSGALMGVLPQFSHVEILRLDIMKADCSGNDVFPLLANLKHLELRQFPEYDSSIYLITCFLKTSPYLQSLKLKWRNISNVERRVEKKADKCPHQNLKVVEMIGNSSGACLEKHAMYFIENIVSLEKIVIGPTHWYDFNRITDLSIEGEEEETRDHIMRHVKPKVPSTVEFVLVVQTFKLMDSSYLSVISLIWHQSILSLCTDV